MITGQVIPVLDFQWDAERALKKARTSSLFGYREWWVPTACDHQFRAIASGENTAEGPYIRFYVMNTGGKDGTVFTLTGHRYNELPEDSLVGMMWAAGVTYVASGFLLEDEIIKNRHPELWTLSADVERLLVQLREQDQVPVGERFAVFKAALLDSGVPESSVMRDL